MPRESHKLGSCNLMERSKLGHCYVAFLQVLEVQQGRLGRPAQWSHYLLVCQLVQRARLVQQVQMDHLNQVNLLYLLVRQGQQDQRDQLVRRAQLNRYLLVCQRGLQVLQVQFHQRGRRGQRNHLYHLRRLCLVLLGHLNRKELILYRITYR